MSNENIYNPHVSVDCVVFGFDGEKLKVLLVERSIAEQNEMYNDAAARKQYLHQRSFTRSTQTSINRLKNIYLSQFKSFGNPQPYQRFTRHIMARKTTQLKIGRIVTVYVALVKINSKLVFNAADTLVNWYDINEIKNMNLAFDHTDIIFEGLKHIRHRLELEPHLFFELLPRKFTITQLRTLHDTVHQVQSDVRNFQKKWHKCLMWWRLTK